MMQAFLFSLLHVYELFLASALTTQVAVSVAVVAVSSAVVYYCQNRGYANYIHFGVLFGGWRAREPVDTGGGGGDGDGGGVLEKYIDPGDGKHGKGGVHDSREREIAGAVKALISTTHDRDIVESRASEENVRVSSGKDYTSSNILHQRSIGRTFRPPREGTKDFGLSRDISHVVGDKQSVGIIDDRWDASQRREGEIEDYGEVFLEGEIIYERKELEAHLQGKTLVTEKREESSQESLAVIQKVCTVPLMSPTKSTGKTKPKHVLSYLDVNEEVKSLHRTTGRLNVRSSGPHNPHSLIECSKQTATKIEHKLKPIKSASEESTSHTQKSDSSTSQTRKISLQESLVSTDMTGTKQETQDTGVLRRSSSPAPIPWIQIFESTSPSMESEHDQSYSLSDTRTLSTPPISQPSTGLDVPPIQLSHKVSYPQRMQTTQEENTEFIDQDSEDRDGGNGDVDSDSCVATELPVSTEKPPVSPEVALPSFEITEPSTDSDGEINKVPEPATMTKCDSLEVPSICRSETVLTKPTGTTYTTAATQQPMNTSVIESLVIPVINEPTPAVCHDQQRQTETESEPERTEHPGLKSIDSLEVPLVAMLPEAYPTKKKKVPTATLR